MPCDLFNATPIDGGLCRIQSGAYEDAVITRNGTLVADPDRYDGGPHAEYIGETVHSCMARYGYLEVPDSSGGGATFDYFALQALRNLPNMSEARVFLSAFANEPGTVCMQLGQPAVRESLREYLTTTCPADLTQEQVDAVLWALDAADRSAMMCYF